MKKKNLIEYELLKFLNKGTLKRIYEIYSHSLPNDILLTFGKTMYEKFANYCLIKKNGSIIISKNNNHIIGFLILEYKELNMIKIINFYSILNFLFHSIINPILMIRLLYQILFSIKKPKKTCSLSYIAVSQKYRSKKIGNRLINYAEKIAKKNKFKNIYTKTYNAQLAKFYLINKKAKKLKSFKIFNYNYYCLYWKLN